MIGGVSAQDETEERQQDKYTVKAKKKLHSRFLLQQDLKEKEKQAALLLEQQKVVLESDPALADGLKVLQLTSRVLSFLQRAEEPPADELRGLRVHCWVLVLSGSREVEEHFFIDPLSGNSYATGDGGFLGIESVWDNYNYYVNMQDCSNDCSVSSGWDTYPLRTAWSAPWRSRVCVCVQGVEFDLEDLDLWEPVLVGVASKKQLTDKILRRREIRFLGRVNSKYKVCRWRRGGAEAAVSQASPPVGGSQRWAGAAQVKLAVLCLC